jgi:hypothetical protein
MITQDELKKLLNYDTNTGIFTWKVKPSNNVKIGSVAGTSHNCGYKIIRINKKQYLSHRLAWLYTYGEMPSNLIDHINGDRSDNKLENLRDCNIKQNAHNSIIPKNNTSGIKGVNWHKLANKWRAQIKLNNKNIHLGLFENLELAKIAIIKARNQYHGEFAHNG